MLRLGNLRKQSPLRWAAVIAIRVFFVWLAILVIAAMAVGPGGIGMSPTTKARADVSEIRKAIGIYRTLTGGWPTSLADLQRPQPQNGGDSIIDIDKDPWGRRYGFIVVGPRAITITCLGADGAPGGEGADEDIVLHWPPPEELPQR